MASDNETFADSMAKLKSTLDCPTDTKLPVKGEWCGLCREICDADGTNYCDRNFYLSKVLAVEAAHEREIAAKDEERLTVASNYEAVICAKDRIIAAKDAEIDKLRSLLKEMVPWLASVGEEVISGKPQEDVRALVTRALEVSNAR